MNEGVVGNQWNEEVPGTAVVEDGDSATRMGDVEVLVVDDPIYSIYAAVAMHALLMRSGAEVEISSVCASAHHIAVAMMKKSDL